MFRKKLGEFIWRIIASSLFFVVSVSTVYAGSDVEKEFYELDYQIHQWKKIIDENKRVIPPPNYEEMINRYQILSVQLGVKQVKNATNISLKRGKDNILLTVIGNKEVLNTTSELLDNKIKELKSRSSIYKEWLEDNKIDKEVSRQSKNLADSKHQKIYNLSKMHKEATKREEELKQRLKKLEKQKNLLTKAQLSIDNTINLISINSAVKNDDFFGAASTIIDTGRDVAEKVYDKKTFSSVSKNLSNAGGALNLINQVHSGNYLNAVDESLNLADSIIGDIKEPIKIEKATMALFGKSKYFNKKLEKNAKKIQKQAKEKLKKLKKLQGYKKKISSARDKIGKLGTVIEYTKMVYVMNDRYNQLTAVVGRDKTTARLIGGMELLASGLSKIKSMMPPMLEKTVGELLSYHIEALKLGDTIDKKMRAFMRQSERCVNMFEMKDKKSIQYITQHWYGDGNYCLMPIAMYDSINIPIYAEVWRVNGEENYFFIPDSDKNPIYLTPLQLKKVQKIASDYGAYCTILKSDYQLDKSVIAYIVDAVLNNSKVFQIDDPIFSEAISFNRDNLANEVKILLHIREALGDELTPDNARELIKKWQEFEKNNDFWNRSCKYNLFDNVKQKNRIFVTYLKNKAKYSEFSTRQRLLKPSSSCKISLKINSIRSINIEKKFDISVNVSNLPKEKIEDLNYHWKIKGINKKVPNSKKISLKFEDIGLNIVEVSLTGKLMGKQTLLASQKYVIESLPRGISNFDIIVKGHKNIALGMPIILQAKIKTNSLYAKALLRTTNLEWYLDDMKISQGDRVTFFAEDLGDYRFVVKLKKGNEVLSTNSHMVKVSNSAPNLVELKLVAPKVVKVNDEARVKVYPMKKYSYLSDNLIYKWQVGNLEPFYGDEIYINTQYTGKYKIEVEALKKINGKFVKFGTSSTIVEVRSIDNEEDGDIAVDDSDNKGVEIGDQETKGKFDKDNKTQESIKKPEKEDVLKDDDTVTVPQEVNTEMGEGSEDQKVKGESDKDNKTPESIKKPEKEEVPKDVDTATVPTEEGIRKAEGSGDQETKGTGQNDSTKSTPSCSYTYSKWGECSRETKEQRRKVIAKIPAGCTEDSKPKLTQGCTPPLTAAEKKLEYFKCLCSSYYAVGETCGGTSSYYNTGDSCGGAAPCACWAGSWSCHATAMPTSPKAVKGCYSSVYGAEDLTENEFKKALQIAKEENRKHAKPLKATMNYEKCPLHVQIGDTLEFSISQEGGLPPYDVSWSGEGLAEKNKFSFIKTTKPGSFVISSTVSDSDGNSATAQCQVIVDAVSVEIIKTSPPENTLPIGSKAFFKAIVKSGKNNVTGDLRYLWEPYPEVQFGDEENPKFETTVPNTIATYTAINTFNMGVKVSKKIGDTYQTIGVSNQIPMEIIAPKLNLNANNVNPLVGEKVLIRVQENPAMDDDMITFWWEIKGGKTINAGPEVNIPNSRAYSFIPTAMGEKNKVIVTVHAQAKDGGADLGEASITIQAQKYDVTASNPKRLDKSPWKWDPKQGKAVELPQAIAVFQNAEVHCKITPKPKGKVKYQWTVNPEGCTVSAPMSKSTYLNAHKTGSYTVFVEVKDKNNVVLGKGSTTFTVTVSQRDLDVAKQKAKDQKKAKELLQNSRELWKEGKLQQAIAKVAQAQKLSGKDKEIAKTLKAMQMQKKDLDAKLNKASGLIKKGKLKDAEAILSQTARISDKYKKYKEVLKQLVDAKKKAQEKEKQIAKLLKDAKALKDGGKFDEAVVLLAKGVKQFPGNKEIGKLLKEVQKQQKDALNKMAEGQAQWKNGLLDKALSTLKEAVKIDPSNKKIVKVLKGMQGQKKMMDDALSTADKLIKQKKFDQAKSALVKAGYVSKKYPPYIEMVKKLDDAKKKDEELANKLLTKAKDLWTAGKLDDATALLTKGSKEFATHKQISQSLQKMQQDKKNLDSLISGAEKLIDQKKFSKAKSLLKKAAKISKRYPPYIKAMKKLEQEKKKDEEEKIAKEELRKKVQQQQENARKKMAEGEAQWKSGALDKAVLTLKEAASIDPSNKKIVKVLKGMQGQKKMMDDALKKEEEKKKQLAKILKNAKVLKDAGKLDEAIEMLKKGSKQFPNNKKIDKLLKDVQKQQAVEKPKTEKAANIGGVVNGPKKPTTFRFNKSVKLLFLQTYHWNNGIGMTSPGKIGLRHSDGTMYGPWQTRGTSGQGGVPNANWEVNPNVPLKPGVYTVIDSDPKTWSTNAQEDWKGFTVIRTGPLDYPDEKAEGTSGGNVSQIPNAISSLVGSWSFGRSKHYGKPVQEHLCNLTLTDEHVKGIGYKIKSCNANESYWILEGKVLLFVALDGTITTKFSEVRPNYWQGTFVGSAHSAEGIVHYLRKPGQDVLSEGTRPSNEPVSVNNGEAGITIPKKIFEPNEKIRLSFTASSHYPEKSWIGMFDSKLPHSGMNENNNHELAFFYLEKKSNGNFEFTAPEKEGQYDFRMFERSSGKERVTVKFTVAVDKNVASLKLPKSIFEPNEKISLSFTASSHYPEKSWIGMFDSKLPHSGMNENNNHELAFFYLEKKSNGNFEFTAPEKEGQYDFRMFERSNGKEVATIQFVVKKTDKKATGGGAHGKNTKFGNSSEAEKEQSNTNKVHTGISGNSPSKTAGTTDNSSDGYWQLVKEKGSIGRECAPKERYNDYYRDIISGFGSHITITNMIRKGSEVYCKHEAEWQKPPEKLYPGTTIKFPVTIKRLAYSGKYGCDMAVAFSLWDMECGSSGSGGNIGSVKQHEKDPKSISKEISWKVKESFRKKAGEKLTIRTCFNGGVICGKNLGMKYYYTWVTDGSNGINEKHKPADTVKIKRKLDTTGIEGIEDIDKTMTKDEQSEYIKRLNQSVEKTITQGKTKTSTSYAPNNRGDVFNGGHWAGASGRSDWIQKDFGSTKMVSGVSIERASTDVTTKGFRLVLKLKKPNGNWITIDELHNMNINRTALSGGKVGKSIPSYNKKLFRAIKATAFKLEFYGHGWFDASNIRIYFTDMNKDDVIKKVAEERAYGFGGKWDTNWGTLVLRVHGKNVTGICKHYTDRRNIELILSEDGKSAKGRWAEPPYKGKIQLRINDDGIYGYWGYNDDKPTRPWAGTRLD